MRNFSEIVPQGLIVSCQAPKGEPLHGSMIMAKMALAAEQGGAIAIRANGPGDIQAIAQEVRLPILGIYKMEYPDSPVYITPTFEEARQVAQAGAHVIALDATRRPRPKGEQLETLIARIHEELNLPVMADVAVYDEGIYAAELGADAVASTLSGYVEGSPKLPGPDLELVRRLAAALDVPVIAEGRYWTPEETRQAMDAGAYGVVVGTAITRPQTITKRFAEALKNR